VRPAITPSAIPSAAPSLTSPSPSRDHPSPVQQQERGAEGACAVRTADRRAVDSAETERDEEQRDRQRVEIDPVRASTHPATATPAKSGNRRACAPRNDAATQRKQRGPAEREAAFDRHAPPARGVRGDRPIDRRESARGDGREEAFIEGCA